MSTRFFEMNDHARIWLADLDRNNYKHDDDTVLLALRLTMGFLNLLGYDPGWSQDFNKIDADLTEMQKMLWGRAAAVLLRNPKVLSTVSDAVSVRTEEVSYSTNVGSALVKEVTQADLQELRAMIFAVAGATQDGILTARRPDYGMQVGVDAVIYGEDPIND